MTLVELMVVIVILVTLVAGVLPLVSPNNDARKITDAARSLQTYFMQAQAEAARLGRPVGVGFRESAPGSGVALEVFQLAVPKPYPGQGINSRARILYPVGFYGPEGLGGEEFRSLYDGEPIYRLQFVRAPMILNGSGILDYASDPYPDGILKIGDVLDLDGNKFLIVDDTENSRRLQPTGYLFEPEGRGEIDCIWINNNGQAIRTRDPLAVKTDPGVGKPYAVHRQPTTDKFGISSSGAYQLPTGIAIDLQASGIEGMWIPETFAEVWEGQSPPKTPYLKQIGIMFSPHGGIDGVWINDRAINTNTVARSGNKLTGVSRIFLMLGRIENQNPPADAYAFDINGRDMTDDDLIEVRRQVNLLNPDSRWLVINTQNGRAEVDDNALFDPTTAQFVKEFQRDVQKLYQEMTDAMSANEIQPHGGPEAIKAEARKTVLLEHAHGDAHGHHDE